MCIRDRWRLVLWLQRCTTTKIWNHQPPPVSYTHLDVYKRQGLGWCSGNGAGPVVSPSKYSDEYLKGSLKESKQMNHWNCRWITTSILWIKPFFHLVFVVVPSQSVATSWFMSKLLFSKYLRMQLPNLLSVPHFLTYCPPESWIKVITVHCIVVAGRICTQCMVAASGSSLMAAWWESKWCAPSLIYYYQQMSGTVLSCCVLLARRYDCSVNYSEIKQKLQQARFLTF